MEISKKIKGVKITKWFVRFLNLHFECDSLMDMYFTIDQNL